MVEGKKNSVREDWRLNVKFIMQIKKYWLLFVVNYK